MVRIAEVASSTSNVLYHGMSRSPEIARQGFHAVEMTKKQESLACHLDRAAYVS